MSDKPALPTDDELILRAMHCDIRWPEHVGDATHLKYFQFDRAGLIRALRAVLAAQAEAHAAELARMQAEFDTACIALQGETAVERYKVETLRAELSEAREQLSTHDAIRAGLEAERDALRDTLSAIETCAERSIGCTASEMDGYMVQISHAARTGSKP